MSHQIKQTLKKGWNHWYREWFGLTAAVILLLCCIVAVLSRPSDSDHTTKHMPIMGAVWETINQSSAFPNQLEQLNDSTVSLQGYMVPITAGRRHNMFLLSVLPINQCMFCGKDGIPAMIEVTLKDQETLPYSEHPLNLKGVIHLNRIDNTRPEIQLKSATEIASN